MDDVEIGRRPQDGVERGEEERTVLGRSTGRAERGLHRRDEPARGGRIAAGEDRHVMPASDLLTDELVDDPLGPAVAGRRHRLERRRDLGDPERLLEGRSPVESPTSAREPSTAVLRLAGEPLAQAVDLVGELGFPSSRPVDDGRRRLGRERPIGQAGPGRGQEPFGLGQLPLEPRPLGPDASTSAGSAPIRASMSPAMTASDPGAVGCRERALDRGGGSTG